MTVHTSDNRLAVAVLISGGGTTLYNLLDKIAQQDLPIEVRLVVSSNPEAGGLAYAEQANIPVQIVPRAASATAADFSTAVFEPCRQAGVELGEISDGAVIAAVWATWFGEDPVGKDLKRGLVGL